MAMPSRWPKVKKRMEERLRNAYGAVIFGIEVLTDTQLIDLVRLRDAEPETGCADLDIYLGGKKTGDAATPSTRCERFAATVSTRCDYTR